MLLVIIPTPILQRFDPRSALSDAQHALAVQDSHQGLLARGFRVSLGFWGL